MCCVCEHACGRAELCISVFNWLVCVCEHVRVTSGARWNTMLIGWRSVGEFEAD